MHGSVLFYSMILNGRVGKVGKGSWSVEFNNSVSDYFGCKRFRDRVIRYIRTSIGYSKQVYIYIYIFKVEYIQWSRITYRSSIRVEVSNRSLIRIT